MRRDDTPINTMLCQNCEQPIEPADEQCPHCGAKPLHRRVYLGSRREEFALTAEEEPFEIGESLETGELPIASEAGATHDPQIEEPSHDVRWGGFFRRACAFIVDWIIVLALALIMEFLIYIGYKVGLSAHGRSVTWETVSRLFPLVVFGMIGLTTIYFVLFHGMEGKTIGKWLLGLKVVGKEQGTITFRRAFLRWVATVGFALLALGSARSLAAGDGLSVATFGFAPLALSFLWVLWSREKKAWHDYLAGTWVIRG
jgi:uncharacterized RDD family membrane protein YckC